MIRVKLRQGILIKPVCECILLILFLSLSFSSFAQNNSISFPNACAKGQSITIAAVGDVLLHQPLQTKGFQNGYDSLWREAIPYIQKADISYANLEGPIAFGINRAGQKVKTSPHFLDKNVYSGFPLFNYHPNLALDLKSSGFDIVSTANNHTLDRYSIGIDKTIQTLESAGIAYVGTRKKGSQSDENWFRIINKNGFKIAWISCTANTNGNDDRYKQVMYCYKKKDHQLMMNKISELRHEVDAIIVSPHWGEEYENMPNETQIEFAHQVLNAGALAVIGSHPHVLQPLQKYVTQDGRATLIMYSLGNFVSYQGSANRRSTVVLLIGLTKTANGTIINGVRFVPMYMQNRSGIEHLRLRRLSKDHPDFSLSFQVISRVMPMGNISYSPHLQTNPECYERWR